VVDLVNLDPRRPRSVIVQAGAFAEHTIRHVRHSVCDDPSWVGDMYDYGPSTPTVTTAGQPVDGPCVQVDLPPSTQIRLTFELDLRTRTPSYRTPFDPRKEGP
jgi:hypothetical protein